MWWPKVGGGPIHQYIAGPRPKSWGDLSPPFPMVVAPMPWPLQWFGIRGRYDSPRQFSIRSCLLPRKLQGHSLRVSWPKTKLQNLGAGTQPPTIIVDENAVDSVDNFIYIGSVITSDGYCRWHINRRRPIGRASSVVITPTYRVFGRTNAFHSPHKRAFIMPWCSLYYYMQPKLGLFSPPILEPSRPFIWSVKCNCCKSNDTNSSGTKISSRQLVFHPSPIPSVTVVTPFWLCSHTAGRRSSPQGTQLSH